MRGNRENRFLVDPADKDAVDRLYRLSAKVYFFAFFIALALSMVSAAVLTPYLGEKAMWVALPPAFVALGVWVACALYANAKRSDILRANLTRLTDSPLDQTRRQLQDEYCRYHRTGNITGIAIFCGCTLAGLIVGISTADYSKGGWGGHIGGITGFAAFAGMIITLAVLFIMLARYTKRIKQAEQFVYDRLTALYEGDDGHKTD